MVEVSGTFFGRTLCGGVRLLRLKHRPATPPGIDAVFPPSEVVFDLLIPAESWAAVSSQVSAVGDSSKRYYEALAFHMNPKS